eukprot:CAMPEP_0178764844 /NCGR_PEP_ID=MMETSP0744-20121128/18063_1 /TAXON_ID=913974 /ORGANISM="Nitzschia punctata, Strain CCMP561" /LENGTH=136 /DNA_ID=CAMNT_0020420157 /DNA_START=1 /DNA_END=411 /DNA_ORIENTATION=+
MMPFLTPPPKRQEKYFPLSPPPLKKARFASNEDVGQEQRGRTSSTDSTEWVTTCSSFMETACLPFMLIPDDFHERTASFDDDATPRLCLKRRPLPRARDFPSRRQGIFDLTEDDSERSQDDLSSDAASHYRRTTHR